MLARALARDPHYVKAGGVLEGAEWFDARFFGIYPREAEIMDPQQRVFLELAWEALEHAGYDPATYAKMIGVFAGAGLNSYLLFNLLENTEIRQTVQPYQLTIANDKDFLSTRVSYKLDLRGPSLAVQTACSTSLVATHLACQSLLNYQCDMALAGGVTIRLPQRGGYLYQEGGIASPDGHCRAFDADAAGTVGGNGAGIVVLKRLADALAERDTIHAVIKATALNNDGSTKVGYTAPSVEGQTDVIATAQAIAGVDPRTISYIEAHGTGTALGDPIEITALTQVFRQSTADRQFCAIGSLKTNVGHLDAAAGVASLIKTALALKHRQIPPSLHYRRPNPRIDFASSPFYVNTSLREWQPEAGAGTRALRAGVSAFGIGGTNAHAVLEEAPPREPSGPSRAWQLLALSARSHDALERATANLAAHLSAASPDGGDAPGYLADVAYTLKAGRRAFEHRRFALARDIPDAVAALADVKAPHVATNDGAAAHRSVAFMFTGQGSQYPDMAAGLYRTEPVFRSTIDECARLLQPHLGLDLRTLILPSHFPGATGDLQEQLRRTAITQPALFAVEYALAQLWLAWGVRPDAMIGHSIGEYVAACLAGVLTLDDALTIVTARGRLMEALPGGAMLSVPLSESDASARLRQPEAHGLALAAVNAPQLSVVSGPSDAVARFEQTLADEGIAVRRLHTSHAFHSAMMDSILSPFAEVMRSVRLSPPAIPYISNVTGTWITAGQATDPAYYAQHLRQAVRFADGLAVLAEEPTRALLEVGPGRTLVTLARQHGAIGHTRTVVASLPGPAGTRTAAAGDLSADDQAFALMALGRLWLTGITPDWDPAQGQPGQPWSAFYADEERRRVPLPTYPFERERYWVAPSTGRTAGAPNAENAVTEGRRPPDDWFYAPLWQQAPPLPPPALSGQRWLVFAHDSEADRNLLAAPAAAGPMQFTTVVPGPAFTVAGDTQRYEMRPGQHA